MFFCVGLVAKRGSPDLHFVASLEPSEILYTVSHHFMENVKLSNKRISLTFDDNSVAMEVLWSPGRPKEMTALSVLGPYTLSRRGAATPSIRRTTQY